MIVLSNKPHHLVGFMIFLAYMKNITHIDFGIIISLILVVAIAGFIRFNFIDNGDILPRAKVTTVSLVCKDGSVASATYYSPNAGGILQKLSLTIVRERIITNHEMISAISASGAKFSTKDGAFSFWEHQDVFRFIEGEKDVTECTKK